MFAWDSFLKTLEQELGKESVDRWVRTLNIIRFDARNIYLEVDDPLKGTWFEEYVLPFLRKGLLTNNGKPIKVHLSSKKRDEKVDKPSSFQIIPDRLDPEHTFENFLLTPENRIAISLFQEESNPEFNPIYLYGAKHAGKTHLLTAFAKLLQQKGKKAFYVRAETFTNHVVQAIRLGRMIEFRNIYRNIDVLLIDDIDFISGKQATQEEFFHTFNTLHTVGKQIIISASTHPTNLSEIEQRLTSRFEWGITVEIQSIDPMQVLKSKATLWNLPFNIELLEFLAKTFPKDPLVALQALALRSKGKPIPLDGVKALLSDLIAHQGTTALTFEKIIQKVAHHYGITEEDLLGKSQTREVAHPRQIAMYLTRNKLKLPFQKIGKLFSRDHSTVMSSVRQIQKGIDEKKIPLEIVL